MCSLSPGIESFLHPAPVAIMIAFALKVSCAHTRVFSRPLISALSTVRFSNMSIGYFPICSLRSAASLGPVVSGTEVRFSIDMVSRTWPPIVFAITAVLNPLRAE